MIGGSLLFVRSICARVLPLELTGCVSTLSCAPARALICALFNDNG